MKYFLVIAIVGFLGYQFLIKEDDFSKRVVIEFAKEKKEEVCGHEGMLSDRGISKERCKSIFEKKWAAVPVN